MSLHHEQTATNRQTVKVGEGLVDHVGRHARFQHNAVGNRRRPVYLAPCFVLERNANATVEFSQAEASLRQIFRAALGAQGQFRPIPNSHPLYHTFYDFDGPPVGSELGTPTDAEQWGVNYRILPQHSYRLEGVFLGDRLVALYSDRGYVHKWAENYGNEPQLRFGINVVVFALTQEGSIAQQQIDYYSEGGAE